MSGRNLNGLTGFQGRTLTGLSNIVSAEDEIVDIKNKIDFDSTVSNGNLLIGNSSGNYTSARLSAGTNITITNADGAITINSSDSDTDIKTKYDFDASVSNGNLLIGNSSGNYTSSNLTAGSNITITNSDGGITIESTDTNFFQKSGSNISALNTTDNLLLGTTTNTNNRKLVVDGTTHITGQLFLEDKINNLTLPQNITDTFCLLETSQVITNKNLTSATNTFPSSVINLFTISNITQLHPILDYNVSIGTSVNTNNRKFLVLGNADISGQLFLGDKINNLTLPQNATDTFCVLATSQSLSNKDLTSATNTFPTFNQSTTGN